MPKPPTTWKAIELKVGEMLGLSGKYRREGATGDTTFDCVGGDDLKVLDKHLGVEVKYRKRLPQWLIGAGQQALQHKETLQEPCDSVVVLVERGAKREDILCVLPLYEYLELRKLASKTSGRIELFDIRC